MISDQTKFSFKIGVLEVSYEGDKKLLGDDLSNTFERMLEVYLKNSSQLKLAEKPTGNGVANSVEGGLDISTNTIASNLQVKSGTDLAIAAAAHLSLVRKQEKFSRKDLLEQMQSATTYYRATYSSNLTKTLKTLCGSKKLNLVSNDTYALSSAEKTSLEAKIA